MAQKPMIIDLSVPLNQTTPVYPGDPPTRFTPAGVFAKDGYNDHLVSVGTHVGTHIDAPWHMLKDGKKLSDFQADRFIGRGRYVKAKNGYDLAALQAAKISRGDIVLFHTGMAKHFNKPDFYYHDFPEMSVEIANYLIKQKVSM